MPINLFTTFHKDKNEARMQELVYCLCRNLDAGFNRIYLICDTEDDLAFLQKEIEPKIRTKVGDIFSMTLNKRATFNDFFNLANNINNDESDRITVIANADIFFSDTDTLKIFVQHLDDKSHTCLALSRWDITESGQPVHFDRADSQDTWVFSGEIKVTLNPDFGMGVAGCDNRLAHEIQQSGYRVLNPSKHIQTNHFHLSGVRNYIDQSGQVKERVPPPYLLVTPY